MISNVGGNNHTEHYLEDTILRATWKSTRDTSRAMGRSAFETIALFEEAL